MRAIQCTPENRELILEVAGPINQQRLGGNNSMGRPTGPTTSNFPAQLDRAIRTSGMWFVHTSAEGGDNVPKEAWSFCAGDELVADEMVTPDSPWVRVSWARDE